MDLSLSRTLTKPTEKENKMPSVRRVLQNIGHVNELYEITTYEGFRNGKKVIIRICDLGPDCEESMRYCCEVLQDDNKVARGNNAPTADQAAAIVHWNELD